MQAKILKPELAGNEPAHMRARIRVAAEALELDEAACADLLKASDDTIRAMSKWFDECIAFAEEHGVSLDWIITGDMAGMFRSFARAA
jgi:hypothetical protein